MKNAFLSVIIIFISIITYAQDTIPVQNLGCASMNPFAIDTTWVEFSADSITIHDIGSFTHCCAEFICVFNNSGETSFITVADTTTAKCLCDCFYEYAVTIPFNSDTTHIVLNGIYYMAVYNPSSVPVFPVDRYEIQKISPNPASTFISIPLALQNSSLKIFDAMGRCVYNDTRISTLLQLDKLELLPGMYYLLFNKKNYIFSDKIILK